MKKQLVQTLEICLAEIESGSDIDACLEKFPGLADELRPALLASVDARSLAVEAIPADAARKGRARLLQHAAGLREARLAGTVRRSPGRNRGWRLAAAVLAVLFFLATGGSGLVLAAGNSLPGDSIYFVKRGWENLRIQVASTLQERQALEMEYQQERVSEINQLLGKGRTEQVEFSGLVTAIYPDQLVAAGVSVTLTPRTEVEGTIALGSWVEVKGETQPNGSVVAFVVKVDEVETQDNRSSSSGDSGSSSSGSGGDETGEPTEIRTQEPQETETPKPSKTPKGGSGSGNASPQVTPTPKPGDFELEGQVQGMGPTTWMVDGNTILVTTQTEYSGSMNIGDTIRVRGKVMADGSLVASRIELRSGSGGDGGTSEPAPTKNEDD